MRIKEYHVLTAALCLILLSLIVSAARNVSAEPENMPYDTFDEGDMVVALTFDDGPKAGDTDAILDMLKEKGVHATFFMIGSQVGGCEDIVRRMYGEGHQIGLHTYSHVDLSTLSETKQKEELEKNAAAIEAVIGPTRLVLRPPFGKMDAALEGWIDRPMVLWSVDTEDWRGSSAEKIIQDTVVNVRDGDIILMHDISDNGLDAAAGIIDELKRMGYTFLTIDEMFACRGIELEDGVTYRWAR